VTDATTGKTVEENAREFTIEMKFGETRIFQTEATRPF
jgi:hypothetical protein